VRAYWQKSQFSTPVLQSPAKGMCSGMNLLEGPYRGATARRFDADVSEMTAGVRLADRSEESSVRMQADDMRVRNS
jgi:hypothetical protein